ncbi:MAG: PEP-CTERM sorting domain-containing protein [Luteolibacter sp.]
MQSHPDLPNLSIIAAIPYYPVTIDALGNRTPIDHGDYRVTLTGDISSYSLVPEPSSSLLLLGGSALFLRRRRS